MGADDMIWGRLTDHMWVEPGADLSLHKFMRPRVEPEIASLLKSRFSGIADLATAMAAIAGIAAALVVGAWVDPRRDFSSLRMRLQCGDIPRQFGTSAAVLGNPIYSLIAAARLAAARGEALEPGDLVM